MSVKASVSMTAAQEAFARDLVARGRYASVSAVVQHGLELLRERTEEAEAHTAALRKLLLERMEGPFVSMEESDRQVEAMIARKKAKLGLDN